MSMNIIYSAVICSEKKFREMFSGAVRKPGQAVQKYNRLLAEGLALHKGSSVTVISELPIDEENYSRRYMARACERSRKVRYVYLPLLNIHRIKDILSVMTTFLECLRYMKGDGNDVVMSDILCAPSAMGAYLAARIKKVPYVAVVTDLPEYVFGEKDRAYRKVSGILLDSATHYIFLTDQMNEKVNEDSRPYAVVEGMTDLRNINKKCDIHKHSKVKKCLYTGNLNAKYGINGLLDGFIKADIPDTELHICGSGELAATINELSRKDKRIVYHGNVLSDEAVRMQKEADLLINPRPSVPEYTKYSFPSKTMEYMFSRVPLLTTDLPGIPDEYKKYVYLIKDESVDGIASALKEVLGKPEEERIAKGREAYEFVSRYKNNFLQATKVMEMLG